MKDMTDEALVERARRGDLEAEETLLRRYKDLVRRRARPYFILGADDDDVIQEGMIGLLKAVRRYDSGRSPYFRHYAELCIISQIISAVRTAARQKHSILNDSISLNRTEGRDDRELLETIESKRDLRPEEMLVLRDVASCIFSNEGNMFSEFEMRVLREYVKGRSCSAIGKDLGRPEKSVDNAVQRVRKKISDYILK